MNNQLLNFAQHSLFPHTKKRTRSELKFEINNPNQFSEVRKRENEQRGSRCTAGRVTGTVERHGENGKFDKNVLKLFK